MTKLEQAILSMHAAGQPFVLASVSEGSGSMPRHRGACMLVRMDGSTVGSVGGGALEAEAIQQAGEAFRLKSDRKQPFFLTGEQAAQCEMICGGSGMLTFAYYPPEREIDCLMKSGGILYILGGGHVGRALAQAAELAELPAVVVDDRKTYANQTRFPHSKCIVAESFARLPELGVGPKDMLVIVTRGHLGDADALRWAVQQSAGYIGMIGSVRKRDMLYQMLLDEGIPQARLAQVHSPIGLSIGSETPGEIAISIMAEIIQERSRWSREETK